MTHVRAVYAGRPGQAGPPRERPLHEGRDAEIAEP
jgi:hypothetical protein